MTAIITQGDAAALPLPDETVDLIVTSPPYFGLRSYTDGGEHYDGQIGDEPSPTEYLDALITCTREWMRVLKPGGSIFVNLGDKYSTARGGDRNTGLNERWGNTSGQRAQERSQTRSAQVGAQPKSLLGLPWRYAIRCTDELGLILRAEVVWSKPNGMPESIRDRVRRSHEQVFHFTKQPRYYSALDEIREPHTMKPQRRPSGRPEDTTPRPTARQGWSTTSRNEPGIDGNPLGKMPSSVWSIPTAPLVAPPELGINHFAAYPPELVRRIILGWSPREVCMACGEGRRPVVHTPKAAGNVKPKTHSGAVEARGGVGATSQLNMSGSALMKWRAENPAQLTGYACACPDTTAPATPGVVLDPFGGTGTTALVASVFGRVGISVDLSADYCRLAQWRTTDEKQRARAGGPKPLRPARPRPAKVLPPPAANPQLDLLDGEAS